MKQIIRLLENHGIELQVHDGRLWAQCAYTYYGQSELEWIDATEWTVKDASKWLGY